jgi:tRNA 2-selenouridine synthase
MMRPSRPVSFETVLEKPFDAVIDVRSPAEFAEDHVPGAINCPVLDDEERARVGTMYKQVSAFEARRVGAALAARNIARHIEEKFSGMPKSWRPLVYCWRGGQRSQAMEIIFGQIGWDVARLDGGYKTYRRYLLETLPGLIARSRFQVINGLTGSGKTALLKALEKKGAQVLDLEGIAAHRGSLLGNLPDLPQPTRKMLESELWRKLASFDPALPVYVEAESRKIGAIELPAALCAALHESPCILLNAPLPARVAFLLQDYADLTRRRDWFKKRLMALKELQSKAIVERWCAWVDAGAWPELAAELLSLHYDPRYARSMSRNYPQAGKEKTVVLDEITPESLAKAAEGILAAFSA